MLKPVGSVVVVALLLLAAAGSSPTPDATSHGLAPPAPSALTPETPLATLGSQPIREADFQRYLGDAFPPEQVAVINASPADRRSALEEYFDSLAIVTKARRAGLDRETRFEKALELMEMKLLAHLETERYRDRIVRESQVSEEDVRKRYEQRQHELTEAPRFTAHHLLVYVQGNPAFPNQGLSDAEARAKAEAALAQLRAGKSWHAVAAEYSDDVPTKHRAGLIKNGRFGYFAAEVERAVKTQELDQPGEVIRSVFGYHVLQVRDRITEKVPRPFEEVRKILTDELAQERSADARETFMTPIQQEVGLHVTDAGQREAPLLDEKAVPQDEVLAVVGGRPILESDFRWFLKDALVPEQRASAYSRPGARQNMLSSYLDMLVLEAEARKDALDQTAEFIGSRVSMERKLLTEFMQQRDQAGPFCRCGGTAEERQRADREYFDRVRAEVGLTVVSVGA